MRKLLVLLVCLFCGSAVSLNAQGLSSPEREAEWKSYVLPQTNFSRQLTPNKSIVFRVPADWKQEGSELVFVGPHGARISVIAQAVPDGYPLTEYVASVLKSLEDESVDKDSILTRRTQFQDLEAREVYVETPDAEGTVYRSTTWITITGPLALNVNILAPLEHATAVEPLFKATVQSVMFVPKNFAEFETVRAGAIKTPAPGPINEIEAIVASLNELNADREAAIKRLTPLFISQPDTVVDLLTDRRVTVRSAATEALARSKNAALKSFLWHVLDDADPFVAEAAAQRLGPESDVAAQLLNRSWIKTAPDQIARVWPFMSKENRVKFLQGLFTQTTADRNVQISALAMIQNMPADEYKLPFERILAADYNPLTIVALRVANDRGEALPVPRLVKLLSSSNQQIRRLAAESLGLLGAAADVSLVENLVKKTESEITPTAKDSEEKKAIVDELKLSVSKLKLRIALTEAKDTNQWRKVLKDAYSNPSLANFAWRFDCEATTNGCSTAATRPIQTAELKIQPFAENLFPQRVTHYTAIPNPAQTVQRFYATLHGLQLESPRAQSNLVLVIGGLREQLGQHLGAPPDAPALIEYTGIKSDSPIALGVWTPTGARDSVLSAQRKAIILRVNDRERFARVVENYQKTSGSFMALTDYLAIGTRAAAALPALLPLSSQSILSGNHDKPDNSPDLTHSVVGQTEWNGIPITTIEHRWIGYDWNVQVAATHLTFIGDVAILTSDIASLRDLLSNTNNTEQQSLAGNEEFRRAIGTDGDIVYFSDLKAVMADPSDTSLEETKKASESGALKFSSSSWENTHRLDFDESEWSKPLLAFHPKDLAAPRELLPSSTLAYYLMKLDLAAAWESWPKSLHLRENRFEIDESLLTLDLKKEVLPELGPECGAVVLELPNFYSKNDDDFGAWAGFCKLKSNKLSDAFAAGKLFRGVGPTTDIAELKSGETSYFVAIKNGFLVVSNAKRGIAALGAKTNLAGTRDYSRAAEKVPAGIVAFGGYNLEAAIAAASTNAGDGLRAQMAAMVFSVASAFHSQSFFATAKPGAIEGRSSVAMDREGRYAVADFSYLPRGTNITFATLEPHGIPITNQTRLSNLILKVRAKAPGPIESIRDDIKSATQLVEQKSANELVVNVAARRLSADKKLQLPITNPELAPFLKATGEFTSDNQRVITQAREIAGDDKDAWSVARKLGEWTFKNLEWKSVARAAAVDTLATREADCSEFSQLYVSMARSLGLPARMVSGLAYSGNSFGGHAWVEVWVGEWVELDPTWGTDFVDATHIRNDTSALVTAAALNLIDVEVLEARRTVGDFQKSPKALAEHLAKVIALNDKSEVEATLDVAVLTDEFMGPNTWNGLNEHDRDLMSSAYRRALKEILSGWSNEGFSPGDVHVLHVEEKGDRAEATCYQSAEDDFLKMRLVRRDNVWYLVDILQSDTGLHVAANAFEPVIKSIRASRAGKRVTTRETSDFLKILNLIDNDNAKAIETADRLLLAKPGDQTFRLLKALALFSAEKDDEGKKLLTELGNEQPPHAASIFKLADLLSEAKPEESIALYLRYSTLEPYDLRAYRNLAGVYEERKQAALAEAAFRKAIAVDPFEIPGYIDLIVFLIRNGRIGEVNPLFVASDKYLTEGDDVLASVLSDLEDDIKLEDAEVLSLSQAHRLKTSSWANLSLSDIYIREKQYRKALEIITRASQIDPELPNPHIAMSTAYGKQSRWAEALKAADRAVSLDDSYATAHYVRACALARLGRKKDAIAAIEKSIELNPNMAKYLAEDEDFKSLRTLPAFKKLIPEPEKPQEQSEPK